MLRDEKDLETLMQEFPSKVNTLSEIFGEEEGLWVDQAAPARILSVSGA